MSPARSTAEGRRGRNARSQEVERLEEAAADVLRALCENLGWQAGLLWVAGEETLSCGAVWHYVEDDGRGFGDNGKDDVGFGLRSIKERVAFLHGTARMYPSPEGGAVVRVCLPLRNGG